MPDKTQTRSEDRAVQKRQPSLQPPSLDLQVPTPQFLSGGLVQRAIHAPGTLTPRDVLHLQRLVGNRAVTQLLAKVPAGPLRPVVQPKLVVGPAGDGYEQEADRVAAQVMSMPAPTSQQAAARSHPAVQRQEEEEKLQAKPLAATITPLVQRTEQNEPEKVRPQRLQRQEEEEVQTKPLVQRQEEEEVQTKPLVQRQEEEEVQTKPLVQRQEEEEVQTKPLAQRQEEEEVQTKPDPQGRFEAGSAIEGRLAALKGGGSPLSGEVRAFMEPRFGADFGGVRLHTGSEAAQMNADLRAQAFTHGQDIYLGAGAAAPGSEAGNRMLAHELAHTIQQAGAVRYRPGNAGRLQKLHDTPGSIQGLNRAGGMIQRIIGPYAKVGDQVVKYAEGKGKALEYTVEEIDRAKQVYTIRVNKAGGTTRQVDFYDPDFGQPGRASASAERHSQSIKAKKERLITASRRFGGWANFIKAGVPFPGVTDQDIDRFEYHFNMYWRQVQKVFGSHGTWTYWVATEMTEIGTDGKPQWVVPRDFYTRVNVLNILHNHTMVDMSAREDLKKLGPALMPTETAEAVEGGQDKYRRKKLGIGYHGTSREPRTVIETHKGTKAFIMTPGIWDRLPPEAPLKRHRPSETKPLFRTGDKDNELFTTVSVATDFKSSTDFPLLHTMPQAATPTGRGNPWEKWKEADGKWHSLTTVFIVGVQEGFDTNKIQQESGGGPVVGEHGEKATLAIPLEHHFGYVRYERIHVGDTREDGHDFVPLECRNLVGKAVYPHLYEQIQHLLEDMNKPGHQKGE